MMLKLGLKNKRMRKVLATAVALTIIALLTATAFAQDEVTDK